MVRTVFFTVVALLASVGQSTANDLRPEMIVTFSGGSLVCLNRDHLIEITLDEMRGENTKALGLMLENGGDCVMVSPNQRFKILSVEFNDPSFDLGLLEITGSNVIHAAGAWAYSIGAEEVK